MRGDKAENDRCSGRRIFFFLGVWGEVCSASDLAKWMSDAITQGYRRGKNKSMIQGYKKDKNLVLKNLYVW